jgi:hypothetical protein
MKAFEITERDIEELDQYPLTVTMKKLLHSQLSQLKLRQIELVLNYHNSN